MATSTSYRETQHFRHPTVWLIVGGVAALMWYAMIRQIGFGEPVGTRPASDRELLIGWAAFGLGLPVLLWGVALVTEVEASGVRLRFRPVLGRRIRWHEITDTQVVTYRPLRAFGGWGMRWGWGRRRAYTVTGDQGVELTLRGGGRILIGSQTPEALQAALHKGIIAQPPYREPTKHGGRPSV